MNEEWLLADTAKKEENVSDSDLKEIIEIMTSLKRDIPAEGKPFWIFWAAKEERKKDLDPEEIEAFLKQGEPVLIKELIWDENLESKSIAVEPDVVIDKPIHLLNYFKKHVVPYYKTESSK